MSRTQQLPNTMAAQTETYEALDLGQLNPRCPYFHSLGQALWFTGELIDSDLVIHPASHELGRKLLESPQLKPLEEVFQSWLTEFELPGARPYAHGSA